MVSMYRAAIANQAMAVLTGDMLFQGTFIHFHGIVVLQAALAIFASRFLCSRFSVDSHARGRGRLAYLPKGMQSTSLYRRGG